MRIYITDLAAYNQGQLYGRWADLPSADIVEIVNKIDDLTRERNTAIQRVRKKDYADYKERKQLKDRIDNLAMLIRHQLEN